MTTTRPPRPNGPTIAFGGAFTFDSPKEAAASAGTVVRPLCAWMAKKNDGLGAILGRTTFWFTLDAHARTLSWAKKEEETPQGTVGFEGLKSVEPWANNLDEDSMDTVPMQETESDNAQPSSRRVSSRGAPARSLSRSRSIGARIRSMSPFRRSGSGVAEHGLIVRFLDRTLDLTCESKLQADQWLNELRTAVVKNTEVEAGVKSSSPGVDALAVDGAQPPVDEKVADEQVAGEPCQLIVGQTSDELSPKSVASAPRSGRCAPSCALVMEDLDDGQLHEIGSPKKADEVQLLTRDEKAPKKTSQCDMVIEAPQRTPKAGAKQVEERKMFDKRELRRRNREAFEKSLAAWREKNSGQLKNGPMGLDAQRVKVCVRKRPLFPHEDGEFDILSARGSELVVHNCLTKADLKSLFVEHKGFHFARTFSEHASDDDVYQHCGEPAIRYATSGKSATIFMFGQTGSGKTHTIQALLEKAAHQLFESGLGQVYVGAFEIAGKSMRDLQDPSNPGKELKVMVDLNVEASCPGQLEEKGCNRVSTKVKGLRWCAASSPTELLQLSRQAQEQRTTRATQANSVSSRSHSVLRIGRSEGDICLTLVDCAGSERNEDSTHHNAQARKDAADINSTIFTLKECFRVMREPTGQQPPFRDSLLTRVLADAFTSEGAFVFAIGTVSPAARDTEHSVETLKALQMLQGTQMTFQIREDVKDDTPTVKHPRTWSEEEVRTWFAQAAGGRGEPWVHSLPGATDGKMLVRMPATRFVQMCGSNKELGDNIFKELRGEMQHADNSKRRQ